MKLPVQPNNYDRSLEQQRSGLIERELLRLDTLINAEAWDDLRMPAQGINPPGAASDPTRSTTTGLLEFSGSADNVVAGVAQMPHEWKVGSVVRPHIHVRCPTANTSVSRWKFEYDIASVKGDFTNNYGTYTTLATVSFTNPNNAKKHEIISFGDLDLAGYKESCCIVWRISRLANSDADDTDTSAIVLVEFDIHYQRNKDGTPQEIPQ